MALREWKSLKTREKYSFRDLYDSIVEEVNASSNILANAVDNDTIYDDTEIRSMIGEVDVTNDGSLQTQISNLLQNFSSGNSSNSGDSLPLLAKICGVSYVEIYLTGDKIDRHSWAINNKPLQNTSGKPIFIDYGDGEIIKYNGTFLHNYSQSGDYIVRIYNLNYLYDRVLYFADDINISKIDFSNFICEGVETVIGSSGATLGTSIAKTGTIGTEYILPPNMTTIPRGVVGDSTQRFILRIPASVTTINNLAFDPVPATIIFPWSTSETIVEYSSGWFSGQDGSGVTFSIPSGTTSLYEAKNYPSSRLVEQE